VSVQCLLEAVVGHSDFAFAGPLQDIPLGKCLQNFWVRGWGEVAQTMCTRVYICIICKNDKRKEKKNLLGREPGSSASFL
jgi:hypothetical protein